MKKRRWLNGCALLSFIVCGGFFAVCAQQSQNSQTQQPKSQQKPGEKKPAGDKQENLEPGQLKDIIINVRLPVTITDKNNRFVVNLKETDFTVIEDKTPQTIIK